MRVCNEVGERLPVILYAPWKTKTWIVFGVEEGIYRYLFPQPVLAQSRVDLGLRGGQSLIFSQPFFLPSRFPASKPRSPIGLKLGNRQTRLDSKME